MRNWFLGLIILSSSLSGLSNQQKVHLPQDKVVLHNGKILIGEKNNWRPASHLSTDENGFYLDQQEAASLFQWECEKCGAENWFWDDYCWVCGRER